jgi:hypothetical protein
MNSIEEFDSIVRASLESLALELKGNEWKGRREREVISLFCFGHLLKYCQAGSVLSDPTQIGIEVAVPQIDNHRALAGRAPQKRQVCKDVVIWPKARMVSWDDDGRATVRPRCVIEWKHNEKRISLYDIQWLREFSALSSSFVGFAVCTRRPPREFTLSCTRVFNGELQKHWLHIA